MEPLYSITEVLNREDYLRYSNTVSGSKKILINLFSTGIGILLYAVSILNFLSQRMIPAFICLIVGFIYLYFFHNLWPKLLNAAYDRTRVLYETTQSLIFYTDHLDESWTELGTTVTIPYSEITSVLENDEDIYLMNSKTNGVIIKKFRCSSEMIRFLLGIGKKA